MPILIDGHNLIGRSAMLSLQDPDDEEQLIRLLASYQARTGKSITVVFDPGWEGALSQTRHLGRLKVVFAAKGSSADALIAYRVRQSREPHSWLVVTSDQGLARVVTQQGARVLSAEAFAAELGTPREGTPDRKEIPPSPGEVEAWLTLFEGGS